jgi:hypothetical protein
MDSRPFAQSSFGQERKVVEFREDFGEISDRDSGERNNDKGLDDLRVGHDERPQRPMGDNSIIHKESGVDFEKKP